MPLINSNEAFILEHLVRRVFNCDRFGVSTLATADYFERNPLAAAIMVVSALYSSERVSDHRMFDQFISDYSIAFDQSAETIDLEVVTQYIDELRNIIHHYY